MTAAVSPPLVTLDHLRRLAPGCDAGAILPHLNAALRKYGIDRPRRIRHFMAQLCHESAGLTRLVENLNYTTPERIRKVWPSRFPTVESARPFVRNPRSLANKVYGGRMGNRGPDDGWLFRGSGPGMVTGRANFARVSGLIGKDLLSNPDLLRTWEHGLAAFAAFWADKGLNAPADQDDLVSVTVGVNGGRIGLDDRRQWLMRAALIWRDQ